MLTYHYSGYLKLKHQHKPNGKRYYRKLIDGLYLSNQPLTPNSYNLLKESLKDRHKPQENYQTISLHLQRLQLIDWEAV